MLCSISISSYKNDCHDILNSIDCHAIPCTAKMQPCRCCGFMIVPKRSMASFLFSYEMCPALFSQTLSWSSRWTDIEWYIKPTLSLMPIIYYTYIYLYTYIYISQSKKHTYYLKNDKGVASHGRTWYSSRFQFYSHYSSPFHFTNTIITLYTLDVSLTLHALFESFDTHYRKFISWFAVLTYIHDMHAYMQTYKHTYRHVMQAHTWTHRYTVEYTICNPFCVFCYFIPFAMSLLYYVSLFYWFIDACFHLLFPWGTHFIM